MNEEEIDDKHYDHLFELYKESGAQFDKQILYIASGALGLSMSFITDIVDMQSAAHKYLLAISWIILVLIILISLTSHYLSMKAINHRIENLLEKKDKNSSFYNSIVLKLNVLMLVGLPVGLTILICFIFLNF